MNVHVMGYARIIEIFDQDATAGSFLRDDGEGGFASGVYRMAREIERLRESRDAAIEKCARAAEASVLSDKTREIVAAAIRALKDEP